MKQTCLVNAKKDEKGIAGQARNDRPFRMKKIVIFVASLLMFTNCITVYINDNTTTDLKKQDAASFQPIYSQPESEKDDITPNGSTTKDYKTSDNIKALNLFLEENNYLASIGSNFNTDERGNDLIFSFRNSSTLCGFGIIRNGVVSATSVTLSYHPKNFGNTVIRNGDYIVHAINGGVYGLCGLHGYSIQGRDFSTIQPIWTNNEDYVRYNGIGYYSESVDNKYYAYVSCGDIHESPARLNMQTGELVLTDDKSEFKLFEVVAKVNDLYYGRLMKNKYTSYSYVSASQYYNIFDNYTVIRADFTPSTALSLSGFSYTKRRIALIDFTGNIARPIYLNGVTDKKVPATLTAIPNFEYKGKYYIQTDKLNYSQYEEIKVPYDLFDNKYIKHARKVK
jgi:hypothetical protein